LEGESTQRQRGRATHLPYGFQDNAEGIDPFEGSPYGRRVKSTVLQQARGGKVRNCRLYLGHVKSLYLFNSRPHRTKVTIFDALMPQLKRFLHMRLRKISAEDNCA